MSGIRGNHPESAVTHNLAARTRAKHPRSEDGAETKGINRKAVNNSPAMIGGR
jgi:hypothetical protein